MANQYKVSTRSATVLLVSAARLGNIPEMRVMLERGANANCWVNSHDNRRKPLVSVVAQAGEIISALLLLEYVNDETVAQTNMGDWRANYDMSPVAHLAHAGEEDSAGRMLVHCRETMSPEQWCDLLFNSACGGANDLAQECATHLDPELIARVEARIEGSTDMPQTDRDAALATVSLLGLEKTTPAAPVNHRPGNRI